MSLGVLLDGKCSVTNIYNLSGRNDAEEALQKLNGTAIGKQTVRLSWGRNPANKQVFSLSFSHYAFVSQLSLL